MHRKRYFNYVKFGLLFISIILVILLFTTPDPPNYDHESKNHGVSMAKPKTPSLAHYTSNIKERNIFVPYEPPENTTQTEPIFKLNGIVFDPVRLSAAFILDARKNKEGVFYEGDKIDNWVVKKIENQKVTLVKDGKQKLVLALNPDVSVSSSNLPPKNTKPDMPEEFSSYLIKSKKLSPQAMEQRKKDIKELVEKMPKKIIHETILRFKGITKKDLPSDANLKVYVANLFMIAQGISMHGEGEKVLFGTAIKPDNTLQDPTVTFSETKTRRIYASFKNQGALKGLSKVFVRWINSQTGTIYYLGSKHISPNKTNNFIWVQKKKGWEKGLYTVELFKIDTMEKVAQGRFQITPSKAIPQVR